MRYFAFLLNFVWEMWQVPFFEEMLRLPHWDGVRVCTLATAGDVVITIAAFWIAAVSGRSRQWLLRPASWYLGVFLLTGVAITIGYEWLATSYLDRWHYSEAMPIIPGLAIGPTPVLQWLLIPPVVVWLARRNLIVGRLHVAATRATNRFIATTKPKT